MALSLAGLLWPYFGPMSLVNERSGLLFMMYLVTIMAAMEKGPMTMRWSTLIEPFVIIGSIRLIMIAMSN